MLPKRFQVSTVTFLVLAMLLTACGPSAAPAPNTAAPLPAPTTAPAAPVGAQPTTAPAAPQPTAAPPAPAAASGVKNSLGVVLPADAAPIDKQVFRYANWEGKNFDYNKNIYEENGMTGYALEPLVWTDADWHPMPGGADSWETSADGLTWTFHLNQKAKWSDGSPVTAADWVYTFQRMMDPKTASTYAWQYMGFKNADKVNKGTLPVTDLGVKAVDDYTLTITTEKPLPYLLMILSFPTSFPINKAIVSKVGDDWSKDIKTVLSNGPYYIAEWNKGKNVIFKLNPYYAGPRKPKVEQIIENLIPQDAPTLTMYQAGEVDFIKSNTQADMLLAVNDPTLKSQVSVYANYVTRYIWFNTLKPPFDNIKVRQAISHAIDRTAITDKVTKGMNIPAYTMLPPGLICSSATDPQMQAYQKYDPALAKQLLADAGFAGGKGLPAMEMWTKQGEALPEGEAIQNMLKDTLGINVTVKDVERAVYVDTLKKGNLNIALGRWYYDYPDPSNFLDWWMSDAGNIIQWKNPKFDDLVKAGDAEINPDKRCALYKQAETTMLQDTVAVFLEHPKEMQLWSPKIGGLQLRADGIKHDYVAQWSDIYVKQ